MGKLPQIEKAKQVGKNLIVVIAGEEPVTVVGDKDMLAPIKELIKSYQEKPAGGILAKIRKLLTPVTVAKAEEKVEKKKAVKQTIKEVTGKSTKTKEKINLVKELENQMVDGELSEKDADEMRALLKKSDAAKATSAKATTSASHRQDRREY